MNENVDRDDKIHRLNACLMKAKTARKAHAQADPGSFSAEAVVSAVEGTGRKRRKSERVHKHQGAFLPSALAFEVMGNANLILKIIYFLGWHNDDGEPGNGFYVPGDGFNLLLPNLPCRQICRWSSRDASSKRRWDSHLPHVPLIPIRCGLCVQMCCLSIINRQWRDRANELFITIKGRWEPPVRDESRYFWSDSTVQILVMNQGRQWPAKYVQETNARWQILSGYN